MSGCVGDLSEKQEKTLKQFKENVADVAKPEYDDYFYLRWLRARSFDLKKSEKMLRTSLAWRKEFDVDNALTWEHSEVFDKYVAGEFLGETKEGNPIYMIPFGDVDVRGIMTSVSAKEIYRSKVRQMEELSRVLLPKASKRHGRRVEQCVAIYDMEGTDKMVLWKPYMTLVKDLFGFTEANYPEVLKKCYVLKAPRLFPIFFNIVKHFLHEHTRKKLVFLNKNEYAEALLEDIEADQLPVYWGGTRLGEGGDPKCSKELHWGGKVPEEYKKIQPEMDLTKFEMEKVGRGSVFEVEQVVVEADSIMEYEFLTEKDIYFGVYKRTIGGEKKQKKSDMIEVVKMEKIDSQLVPGNGAITCTEPGTYVLMFDNSASVLSSKKIYYTVEVFPPRSFDSISSSSSDTSSSVNN